MVHFIPAEAWLSLIGMLPCPFSVGAHAEYGVGPTGKMVLVVD
ncbi:MAG TPA: hypothetical protein VIG82_01095 [Enteractinococcus sp.]